MAGLTQAERVTLHALTRSAGALAVIQELSIYCIDVSLHTHGAQADNWARAAALLEDAAQTLTLTQNPEVD